MSKINKTKTTLLVDGNNLLHRVFWVASKISRGRPESLFLASIRKLVNEWEPTDVFVAWDSRLIRDTPNFRKELNPDYKGNRDLERNKEVYEYELPIRKLLKPLGVKSIHPGVLEADDVIGYLCDMLPGYKVVVSSDQDLLQLLSPATQVHNPIKKVTYNLQNFTDYFPVPHEKFLDFKALMGDKSDNIAGIPKVGPKRASSIVRSGVRDTLSDSEFKIYTDNLKMVDITYGLKSHPEEKSIYKYQVTELESLQPDYTLFSEACEEIGISDAMDYNYDMFFKDRDINSSVLSLLS